jgi:hypothetical protein
MPHRAGRRRDAARRTAETLGTQGDQGRLVIRDDRRLDRGARRGTPECERVGRGGILRRRGRLDRRERGRIEVIRETGLRAGRLVIGRGFDSRYGSARSLAACASRTIASAAACVSPAAQASRRSRVAVVNASVAPPVTVCPATAQTRMASLASGSRSASAARRSSASASSGADSVARAAGDRSSQARASTTEVASAG